MQKATDLINAQFDITILPFVVQDIANLIGLPDALKLVDTYKGRSMWVPKLYSPECVLCKLVGHESALKLIKAYGNESIEMPKCDEAMRVVRNALIRASDKSQSALAQQHNLTVRQIRNIQNGGDGVDEKQESLF